MKNAYLNDAQRYFIDCAKSVLNENSSLNTTKKDTSSHGIGHKSVKRTMQKVGGALKYYETGDLFCAEAVFPIK